MHLDPDLAAALPTLPDLHIHDLPAARARMRELATDAQRYGHDVMVSDHEVSGVDGHRVPVRVYAPPNVSGPPPALLLLHGGGFVMGDLATTNTLAMDLCSQ